MEYLTFKKSAINFRFKKYKLIRKLKMFNNVKIKS